MYFKADRYKRGSETETGLNVYAFATHSGKLLAMMGFGAETAIQAAHAKLVTGQNLNLDCNQAMSFRGVVGPGKLKTKLYRQNLPTIRKAVGIYLNGELLDYAPGEPYAYVLSDAEVIAPYNDENTVQKVGTRLMQIVQIGILPEWFQTIVAAGRKNELIFKVTCMGCCVWGINADPNLWTNLVSELLIMNRIAINLGETR